MLVEICLPVKNEAKILTVNLQRVLDFCQTASFSFDWKIVGLINGSSDATRDIFSVFKNKYPTLIEYVEISNPGRGYALKKYWLESRADVLSYLDIDLAVLPNQLPALLSPLINNEADLVIGSRLLIKSEVQRSLLRETTSRFFNLLTRLIFSNRASDLQCGFKAIKTEAFKKIAPFIQNNYWFFDSELVILSQYFSFRLQEIPVNWSESRYEKRASKVKVVRDIIRSFKDIFLFWIRLKTISKN